tara:strand:+ start:12269 stop:14422 length:2154 start_codon:yes stop_codon:yes gene_type:complete
MSIDSDKLTKFLTKLKSIDSLLKEYKISSNYIDNYTSNNVEKLHKIAAVIPTDNTVILSEHEFNTVIKKSSVSKIIEFNNSEKPIETTDDDSEIRHVNDIKTIKKSENSDKVYQINLDDLKNLKENSVYKDHSKYIEKPLSYHYIMLYAIVKSVQTLFGVNIQQHSIEETLQEGGGGYLLDSIKSIFNPNAGKPNYDKQNDDENVGDGVQENDGANDVDDVQETDYEKPSDGKENDEEKSGENNGANDFEEEIGDNANDYTEITLDNNGANDVEEENDGANAVDDEETDNVKGNGREASDDNNIDDEFSESSDFSHVIDSGQSGIQEISSESLFFRIRSLLTIIKDSEVSTQQEKFIEFLKENIVDTDNNKILGIYDVYNIYTKNKELFESKNNDKELNEKIEPLNKLLNSINEKYKNIETVRDTNYTSNYEKLYNDIDDIINPKTTFSVTHIRDQYISKIKDQLNLLILENKKVNKDYIYYNSLKYLLTNNKLYDILININIIIVDFNIEILEKLDKIIDKFIKSIKQEKKTHDSTQQSDDGSSLINEFTRFKNEDEQYMGVANIKDAIDKLSEYDAEKIKKHVENLTGNTNSESVKSQKRKQNDSEIVEEEQKGEQEQNQDESTNVEEPNVQELEERRELEQNQDESTNVEESNGQEQEQQYITANAEKEHDKKPERGGKTRLYIKDKGLKKSKRRIKRSINNRRKIKKNTKKLI